ncbi:MAG: hypothetical protein VX444_12850 [Pseudomonadota bacterium]|nr:hypothetical protein [Pseudomonadota bacterium]
MNTMQTANGRRVGILGPQFDPLGQLLEDQVGRGNDVFLPLVTPPLASDELEEIVVLSQAEALAHLPDLAASPLPCKIVLRRSDGQQTPEDWQASLRLLANALDGSEFELLAISEGAAIETSEIMGRPVGCCPDLIPVKQSATSLPIDRQREEATFFLDQQDGSRDVRRLETGALSWVKLRRLARIAAQIPEDQDLADLTDYANANKVETAPAHSRGPLKVLSLVPNGVGLGHITRMMAIASALKSQRDVEVVFWCFSRAAEILQAAGYPIILRQTAAHLQAHPPDWRAFETLEFALQIQTLKPDIVTYDGAMIDPFVFDALRMPGCGKSAFVWVRRGMLSPDSDPLFLENEQYADLILEPGDLAVAVDKGPTRTKSADKRGFCQSYESKPVSLAVGMPAYTPREAKKRMKLGRGKHCLVSLGGAFGDWDVLESALLAQAKKHKVKLIWAQSPLAPPPRMQGSLVRRLFPLSRYLPGIDGVVTATGYNSFHELMLTYDGPVLFAPTNHIRMDDQVARASYAAEKGWASVVRADDVDQVEQQIAGFMQQVASGHRFENRPRDALDAEQLIAQFDQMLQPLADVSQEEVAV